MTKKKATDIVRDFLEKFNPSLWDGEGAQPRDFNNLNYASYDIGKAERLHMEYAVDEDALKYCCECSIYAEDIPQTLEIRSTDQINSIEIIADMILDLYDAVYGTTE